MCGQACQKTWLRDPVHSSACSLETKRKSCQSRMAGFALIWIHFEQTWSSENVLFVLVRDFNVHPFIEALQ